MEGERPQYPLLIFGAGGHARECAWHARAATGGAASEGVASGGVAFVLTDTGATGGALDGMEVLTLDDAKARFPGASCVIGIGDPATRRRVAGVAAEAGFAFTSIIHPSALIAPDAVVSAGAVVFAQSIVSCAVVLGPHVHVNAGCSISHDCRLDAFATLSPGVRLAGNVQVGAGSLLGISCSVRQGRPGAPLRIGADVVVGAGACVVRDVPSGITVAGVPARSLVRDRASRTE